MTTLVTVDRFHIVSLKLHIESTIVDEFLAIESAVDIFSFGNAHSYALLKESSMKIIVHHSNSMIKTKG